MGMSSVLSTVSSSPPTWSSNGNGYRNIPAASETIPMAPRSRSTPHSGVYYSLILRSNKPFSLTLGHPRRHVMAANGTAQPAAEPASPAPANPWAPTGRKGWIAGIVVTLLLPFLKSKWGPLLLFKDKFDTELRKVEDAAEAVEEAAEGLEKAAEDFAEKLPGGQLKNAALMVEHAAEEVAKDAHLADAAIDKIQELEGNAGTYFAKSRSEKANKRSQEAKTTNNEQEHT